MLTDDGDKSYSDEKITLKKKKLCFLHKMHSAPTFEKYLTLKDTVQNSANFVWKHPA